MHSKATVVSQISTTNPQLIALKVSSESIGAYNSHGTCQDKVGRQRGGALLEVP